MSSVIEEIFNKVNTHKRVEGIFYPTQTVFQSNQLLQMSRLLTTIQQVHQCS